MHAHTHTHDTHKSTSVPRSVCLALHAAGPIVLFIRLPSESPLGAESHLTEINLLHVISDHLLIPGRHQGLQLGQHVLRKPILLWKLDLREGHTERHASDANRSEQPYQTRMCAPAHRRLPCEVTYRKFDKELSFFIGVSVYGHAFIGHTFGVPVLYNLT